MEEQPPFPWLLVIFVSTTVSLLVNLLILRCS